MKPCKCGHTWQAHQHYNAATSCALCNCGRYRPRRFPRLGRTWREAAAIIADEQQRASAPRDVTWDKTPVPPLTRGGAGTSPGIYGRCVTTVHFYDTGITVALDHIHRRRIVDVPPIGEWGDPDFLKDINDQH